MSRCGVWLAVVALALGRPSDAQTPPGAGANFDWPLHNLDVRNSRYAPLDEINASNAARRWLKSPSGVAMKSSCMLRPWERLKA